jgi:hypothetical protein
MARIDRGAWGGFYTDRWVDHLLFPADPPSSDSVLPES